MSQGPAQGPWLRATASVEENRIPTLHITDWAIYPFSYDATNQLLNCLVNSSKWYVHSLRTNTQNEMLPGVYTGTMQSLGLSRQNVSEQPQQKSTFKTKAFILLKRTQVASFPKSFLFQLRIQMTMNFTETYNLRSGKIENKLLYRLLWHTHTHTRV